MDFSLYLRQKVLQATILRSTYTAPPTVWVCLATSVNTSDGTVTEVTTNTAYARQEVSFTAPTSSPLFASLSDGVITFPAASTPWGSVAWVTLVDSDTIGEGNHLYVGPLTTPRTVVTSTVLSFPDNLLTVTMN